MSSRGRRGQYKVLSGLCPDPQCKAKLFFPAHDLSIECSSCGQRHAQSVLTDIAEVTNPQVALHNILKNILLGNATPKKGTDSVKVLGVSNYQCKMISPLLTRYGMDKQTGRARLLEDMGQGDMFECSLLGDRAFLIEPEHTSIVGYGRDKTGSMNYLKDSLNAIRKYNGDEERLLPIHADGDGHCLVHALSRALIGRELFWHALRQNLAVHFRTHMDKYKRLFQDFISDAEWDDIVAECAPDFSPQEGEYLGLRNIHLFGLANVLHRPIVLLDSLSGLQSSGDYAGIFLPALCEPSKCRGKDRSLNKPLCVAWSSSAHNHYVALVAVKGSPLPRIPNWMVPKAWGVPNDMVKQYIDLDKDGAVTIGGNKGLTESYILRLVQAMEGVFQQAHGVTTSLVADVHQYVYKSTGIVGVLPELVIETTQKALKELRLYRCLTCDALTEWSILPEQLRPGGSLYQLAISTHGRLSKDKHYSFPMQGLICSYDPEKDILIPQMSKSCLSQCQWCQGLQMRQVQSDGTPKYQNGDKTKNRTSDSKCGCGFKHYWDGKEYDNLPEMLPITLEWNGQVVGEKVTWFQYETDPSSNSNVYEVANKLVQKHFPGEFGSERLAQKVVDTILRQTAKKGQKQEAVPEEDPLKQDVPTKIILTGQHTKSIHKEELSMSETEKKLKSNIESKAAVQQKRKTDELAKQATQSTSPVRLASKQQKTVSSPPKPSTSKQPPDPQVMDTSPPMAVGKDSGANAGGARPKEKKIRVTTSDGKPPKTLSLTGEITFSELQQKLHTELGVPPERQRLRLGFPPKVLVAPADNSEDKPLDIKHGDRLMVEVIPDKSQKPPEPVVKNPWPMKEESRTTWSSFDATTREQSAQDMLSGLQDLHDSTDSIDMSIATLSMLAKLQGKDLWRYVQGMPHLFSVGGLFYEQVKRDLTLAEGKHCTLPAIPGKVFRYNSSADRLELCLEPHGHYPIEPGVEARVMKDSLVNIAYKQGAIQGRDLATGSAGIVVNPHMKYPNCHQAFTGQGHSLRGSEDDHMPKELQPVNNQKKKAARFRTLSTGSTEEAIPEEDDDAAGSKDEGMTLEDSSTLFRRVGPGCTVLQDDHPTNSEILHTLATCIENYVEEHQELDEPEPTTRDNTNQAMLTKTEQEMDTEVLAFDTQNKELSDSDNVFNEGGSSTNCDNIGEDIGSNRGTVIPKTDSENFNKANTDAPMETDKDATTTSSCTATTLTGTEDNVMMVEDKNGEHETKISKNENETKTSDNVVMVKEKNEEKNEAKISKTETETKTCKSETETKVLDNQTETSLVGNESASLDSASLPQNKTFDETVVMDSS